MTTYRERRSSVIDDAVVWTSLGDGGEHRILPDGCMDVIWTAEAGLIVAGPDTVARIVEHRRGTQFTGLRFPPGVAPFVLAMPARELRDQSVSSASLAMGKGFARFEEALSTTSDPAAALEAWARQRLQRVDPRQHRDLDAIRCASRAIRAGHSVVTAADAVGLSARQLHRRALDAFGYGPKMLGRILRMNDALVLARRGVDPARAAASTGYADQAHLAREVKALAGVPLGKLLG